MPGTTAKSRLALLLAASVAAVLVVGGCAQTAGLVPSSGASSGASDGKGPPEPAQYPDIPIPRGAKRNIDKTVVVGSETWFGQLSLDTTYNADAMFDFYQRELPNFGWRRITSVRAPVSVLSYDREDRVLTISIQPNRIRGSEITVTVSPREDVAPPMTGPGPGPGAAPMPAPPRQ